MKALSPRGQRALQELLDVWTATIHEEVPKDIRELLDKLK